MNDFNEINQLNLKDFIPYNLKNGINLINTNLMGYYEYIFILKHYNNIPLNNIEIYKASNEDFYSKKTKMNNTIPIDINNDNIYTYQFFNFKNRPYLIIFYSNYSDITLRQSRRNENDIDKYYDFNEKKVEILNSTKIILNSGINIINIYNDKYYFKYTLDSKYFNKLKTIYFIDDESDLDNIVDFYEREKSNIRSLKYIKYDNIIDAYLETYNIESKGNKTAVFMFDYYNANKTLTIDLSLSNNILFTSINMLKSQNETYTIYNKAFFINITLADFKDDDNDKIQFEIKGNISAFNSTQIYINSYNYQNQTEILDNYDNCSEVYSNNEITLSCNYTKSSNKDNAVFMLLLNEGNQINIRNIVPEKKDPDEGEKGTSALKYFYYIGIPAIVIVVGIVITIVIVKIRKKKNIDDSLTKLTGELGPKAE